MKVKFINDLILYKKALISDLAALEKIFLNYLLWNVGWKKRKENFECTKADAAANIRDLYLESLHKKNLPPFQLSSISLQSFRFNLFLFHFSSFDFLSSTPAFHFMVICQQLKCSLNFSLYTHAQSISNDLNDIQKDAFSPLQCFLE